MKRLLIAISALIVLSQSLGLSQEITNKIILDNNNDHFEQCIFGIMPDATDGIDTVYGEFEFPNFAPSQLQGAFYISPTVLSYKDFRAPVDSLPDDDTYKVDYYLGVVFGADTITISWDLDPAYVKNATISDAIDGSILTVDMIENKMVKVGNEFLDKFKISIEYNKVPTGIVDKKNVIDENISVIADDIIFFDNEISDVDLYIFDLNGRKIDTDLVELESSYLNINNLDKGFYIIVLKKSGMIRKRINLIKN